MLLYGVALGLLITLLKFIEYRMVIKDHMLEAYGGMMALIFTVIGTWLGLKLTKTRKEIEIVKEVVVVEKMVFQPVIPFVVNDQAMKQLGISQREHEVLGLIARGYSNQQIADELFVSLNTIKTHSSRLFEKLDVNRRTQAVQKAKELGLIP